MAGISPAKGTPGRQLNRRTLLPLLLGLPLAAINVTSGAPDRSGETSQSQILNQLEVPLLTAEDLDVALDRTAVLDARLLPERLRQLEGKQVRIRGYIHVGSVFQASDIPRFVLTPETTGEPVSEGKRPLPLKCVVLVKAKPDRGATFSMKPISVQGVLRFNEFRSGGELIAIYMLDEAVAAPASPRAGYRNSVDGHGC